jgi:CRP/FNR family transcriptional regulator
LLVEELLKQFQKRIESFLFETAEVRYINYLKEYPDLIERISISNLCTYLGIERQSLTRIRKKLTKHKM